MMNEQMPYFSVEQEEIDLTMAAYSKEQLAEKHVRMTKEILWLEKELKAARGGNVHVRKRKTD